MELQLGSSSNWQRSQGRPPALDRFEALQPPSKVLQMEFVQQGPLSSEASQFFCSQFRLTSRLSLAVAEEPMTPKDALMVNCNCCCWKLAARCWLVQENLTAFVDCHGRQGHHRAHGVQSP